MTLSADDVKKIAHLARLAISEKEGGSLKGDLSSIISLIEQMSKEDTSQVEPMAHPCDETQPLRADVVQDSNQRSLFQSIAPKTEAGLYLVPQVLDNE
jgi:aspartyl-tRNA(Asn)/glutamyl-tRNA(Gln) amidotransferase subunit C